MDTLKRKAYVIEDLLSFLLVLLFVYASVSKILDFQNFRTEMGQSPMLNAYAHIAAPGVLMAELFLAVLLSIPSTRRWALLLSFSLMCMFTAYIIIILNFSDYVPCSCGGVLQQLGWKEHILFNLVFVGFAAAGFVMSDVRQKSINKPYHQ